MNRKDLINLLNFITSKLPTDVLFEPLHDANDKTTEKLLTSYVIMSNDNGKATTINVSSMITYSKMSLHAFGSGSTGYSSIYGEII